MKKILLILFLAIGYLSFSQGQPTALPTLYNGKIYQYTQYLAVDSGLFSPRRDTNFVPKQGGCVVFKTSDSTLYVSTGKFTGRKWKGIGSGGGTGVYNAGYGMLLIAGNFSVDTTIISTVAYSQGLYNILNSVKLNITDTSSMLIPYLRKADTTAMLSKYLRKADTITISNRINLKRNISDTALNAQSTLTRGKGQNLIDSLKKALTGNLTSNLITSWDGENFKNTIIYQSLDNYVGIGIQSPSEKLTISGGGGFLNKSGTTVYNNGYTSYVQHEELGDGKGSLILKTYDGVNGGGQRVKIFSTGEFCIDTATQPKATLTNMGSTSLGIKVISSTSNDTLANYTTYVFSGASATNWYLPEVAATNLGRMYFIKNRGSATLTINRLGIDNIYTTSIVTSFSISASESAILQSDGEYWIKL